MTIEAEVALLTSAVQAQTAAVATQQVAVSNAVTAFTDTTSRVNALDLVDNTADASKPISTDVATALATKQDALTSTNLKTVNGLSLLGLGNVVIPRGATSINTLGYEARGTLRDAPTILRALDDSVLIEGIGLFVWVNDQIEPDDDETCFTDNLGQWLLSVPAYDLLSAMALVEESYRDDLDEDEFTRFAAYFATL